MAYCVECGVELAPGTQQCPLCGRKVIAPKEIIQEKEESLFPSPSYGTVRNALRLDKYRQGITELVLTFAVIAILTLTITGVAFGSVLMFWRPAAYIVTGTSFFLVLLFSTLNYRNIATWYSLLTILTLIVADSHDLQFTWVAYPFTGLILFYTFSVFMLYRRIPIAVRILISVTVLLASLALFDLFTHHALTWFIPVGVPVVAVVIITLCVTFIRYVKGNPSITEMILMLLLSASISTVSGDFFALRWKESDSLLSWSFSLFVISLLLCVFIIITMSVKKVRYYFHNKIT
ncbi:MAG: hypothetical protein JXK93_06680 [Sphaerochaetaceae bacterium]|nr:hypothetical protein [Sphaerochaetaceae bacterium]